MIGRHLLVTLRGLRRARAYSLISVVGLAIGIGAALLIALYVNDELAYERWLPDSDRVYLISVRSPDGGMTDWGPSDVRDWVVGEFPQFAAVTRLFASDGFFTRDGHQVSANIVWADPNVSDVLRFPVIAGSLIGALDKPDTLVLTRRAAGRFFGRPDPLGETLVLDNKHTLTVTAVIEDLPSNTDFPIEMLAASRSNYSPAVEQEKIPMTVVGAKRWNSRTYGLLKPSESIEPLREAIRTLPDRHSEVAAGGQKASEVWPLIVRSIRKIHLGAHDVADPDRENVSQLYGVVGIGVLILLVAAINFVTLRTALAMRRAIEVGVRKACGASREELFTQFTGEVFVHVCVATVLGVVLAVGMLPALNVFLSRTIPWRTLLSPLFAGGVAASIVVLTLLAGSYPAFVLAAFRPSTAARMPASGRLHRSLREGLVALQFAIVVIVVLATIVVYRQTAFGMREALRQNSDPTVLLRTRCSDALRAAMQRLPGVKAAACSSGVPQAGAGSVGPIQYNGSERLVIGTVPIGIGFFELYGIDAVAGRTFSDDFGTDRTPADNVWTTPEAIVLNEAAVAKLGIPSAKDAIGAVVNLNHGSGVTGVFTGEHDARIIGVVKDFQMGSVRQGIYPSVFFVDPWLFRVLNLKLDGRSIPETLDAIDRVWADMGDPGPAQRGFFEQTVQQLYGDLRRDFQLFSVFAGIAILISALGLIGLAAHAASARTKEIGLRKVLGSGRGGILGLLMWQFSRPVLLANVIAWPVAYVVMGRWLEGFARRIEFEPWMFIGAGVAALSVAAATVILQAWTIAGIRPIVALRHE